MLRGLMHRCTIWTGTGVADDELGQPLPATYVASAIDVPCRLSNSDAQRTTLLVGGGVDVAAHDRISDIREQSGAVIDAGPFSVGAVEAFRGRANVAFQRLQLERLIDLDQE